MALLVRVMWRVARRGSGFSLLKLMVHMIGRWSGSCVTSSLIA